MTPEMAFSHPFISKAVNELKCLRTTGGSQSGPAGNGPTNNGQSNSVHATSDVNGKVVHQSPAKNSVATTDGKSAT